MSDPASTVPPKPKRRWLRRVLWAFCALVLLLVAARLVAGWVIDARLEARIAALRKAGEPVTFADFPLPKLPYNQNAMPLYEEAFVVVDMVPRETLLGRRTVDKETGCAVYVDPDSLDDNSVAAVRLLRAAAFRSQCAPVLDLRACQPDEDLEPNPKNPRAANAVRLLSLSSRLNLAAGRPDEALEDISAGLRVGRALCEQPTILSLLIRQSFVANLRRPLQSALDEAEPSAAALQKTAQALDGVLTRGLLVESMRGDRCLVIAWGKAVLKDPNFDAHMRGGESLDWVAWRGKALRPVIVADLIACLDMIDYWVNASQRPWPELGNRGSREEDDPAKFFQPTPWYRPFTCDLDRNYYRCVREFHRTTALVDCMRLAVSLRLYRMKHGAYPDALDALTPEFVDKLPLDPFSGKPYLYRREGEGFLLYSVGPNAVDDGGVEVPGDRDQGDIVWKCMR